MVLQSTSRGVSYNDFMRWAEPAGEGRKISAGENQAAFDNLVRNPLFSVTQAEPGASDGGI